MDFDRVDLRLQTHAGAAPPPIGLASESSTGHARRCRWSAPTPRCRRAEREPLRLPELAAGVPQPARPTPLRTSPALDDRTVEWARGSCRSDSAAAVGAEAPAEPESRPMPDFDVAALEAAIDRETHRPGCRRAMPPVERRRADDEQVKVIGPLRISIPLFNIYLNEADELSRRLGTELAEWALEHERHPVPESQRRAGAFAGRQFGHGGLQPSCRRWPARWSTR